MQQRKENFVPKERFLQRFVNFSKINEEYADLFSFIY